jgi:4-hydroxy-tetrahydrodipicolinate synthase
LELHALMFVEPNPAPAKAALAGMGRMSGAVRLPILPAGKATQQQIGEALKRLAARRAA